MIKRFIFYCFIIKLVSTEPVCEEGQNNCKKCNYLNNLCFKCTKDIYKPDKNGGCTEGAKECIIGKNYCIECTEKGDLCKTCDEGYFPDENGGCSFSPFCEISYNGECIKCIDNYILIGKSRYLSDLRICQSKNSENFKNCETINADEGICSKCEKNYYLNSGDFKCIKTQNCSESSFGICTKCIDGYYFDRKENECKKKDKTFLYCRETLDGINCNICDDGYYLSEDEKCTNVNYCSKVNDNNQCEQCISNYYLSSECTITEHCNVGDKDTGLCLYCEENYYIDYKDGKCKSNQEDNDFKYCWKANGECTDCIYEYFLGEDFKCSSTSNCSESNLGICQVCSDNFYLGLDNICSNVEHCIYSDRYHECIECEDNYYYNILDKKCIEEDSNYTNCRITDWQGKYCDHCKENFCLNQTDHTCFDNTELNSEFYKCDMTDSLGRFCVMCEKDSYLGMETLRCSKIHGCEQSNEDDSKCIDCGPFYCLDAKTGKCMDNDIIEEEEDKMYYKCNRTNEEGTKCEICLDGYELDENGLCVDIIHCEEKNEDGSCKRCIKDEDTYYFYCSNKMFGCIETLDYYCLECNDIFELKKCTKCIEGYELNENNDCVELN